MLQDSRLKTLQKTFETPENKEQKWTGPPKHIIFLSFGLPVSNFDILFHTMGFTYHVLHDPDGFDHMWLGHPPAYRPLGLYTEVSLY